MNKSQQVITFGCRLNIYESEIIRKNLIDSELDDVVVINTCAVTSKAERKAKQAIRKIKNINPKSRIIVTGCAAQKSPEMFKDMKEVDKVIGNEEKLSLAHYNFDHSSKVVVNNIMLAKKIDSTLITGFQSKARAFIQIQNGCDHRCTFCIIPYVRGNSRSVPIGLIVKQIQYLLNNGYKEIVMTGVDVTSYGFDLPGKPTFGEMIRRVLAVIPELKRLRLSSIDVAEIDEELFDLMIKEKKLMPHFHISLQSGDNMILKRMKRRHNREQVIEFCNKIRSLRPEVSFGADIIAGFPTESEQMFENTKNLIKEADLQYLHIFPYSKRDNTPATKMPQVQESIKRLRVELLKKEGEKQVLRFYKENIGRKVNLLVENNKLAHTENFIPVKLTKELTSGTIIGAELIGIEDNNMIARLL